MSPMTAPPSPYLFEPICLFLRFHDIPTFLQPVDQVLEGIYIQTLNDRLRLCTTKMSVKRVVRSHQNLKKYEIQKSLKQKVGRGLRGSGPHSERIPRKLTCWVLRYGIMVQNFQRIFSNFPIIFQFSLYMQKLTPTWGS